MNNIDNIGRWTVRIIKDRQIKVIFKRYKMFCISKWASITINITTFNKITFSYKRKIKIMN